ncbi:MAG TPA: hypothetical protein VJT78_04450 [Candidatus Dormibacteraeota bacterium]|nr:hypothetical protein [Candidatus Dormibacteraeota bacterium]
MDQRTQRRVLLMVGGMLLGYVLSAACFAAGFIAGQRWLLIGALVLLVVASGLSTLIRPVALGFRRWWTDAPPVRRVINVALVFARVALIAVFVFAAVHLRIR